MRCTLPGHSGQTHSNLCFQNSPAAGRVLPLAMFLQFSWLGGQESTALTYGLTDLDVVVVLLYSLSGCCWSCRGDGLCGLLTRQLNSGMECCSQVSVINITQQSWRHLSASICNLSSSILFTIDLALERRRLGSGVLSGCLFCCASRPALQPCVCFLYFHLLLSLLPGSTAHGNLRVLAISSSMFWKR